MVGSSVLEALSGLGGELRYIGIAVVFAVLTYWTLERVWGEGDDPTIRFSGSSDTGTFSFLSSGLAAVLLVAGVGFMLIYPEIATGQAQLIAVGLGGIVLAHWYAEKEERE